MGAKFVILFLGLASIVNGELLIQGPNHNVMEGDSVILKCFYSDNRFNISRVRFESYSELLQMWRPVWPGSWCFYKLHVEQKDDKMVLEIPHIALFSEGVFRCMSDDQNLTAPNNASKKLSLKVHYLGDVQLSREGSISFLGLSQELRVRQGDDIMLKCSATASEEPNYFWYKEDSDWMVPSAIMTLKKVTTTDTGVYTCYVEHPTMLLNKMRNISLVVLPENVSWFETDTGRLVLMTLMIATFVLSVLIAMLSVCIYRRKKQAKTTPIDDRSQTKPIYKDSSDALYSNCGDKQPLVAV
ncbi:uncharacterized protein si:ch211-79k12.1 [Corythoichthys intestinalis]|uniref:uncharacterized protein si:ch211-79k12.1 n=1 Tax=Corythoichthys intestinalis TaxID=161448 RepID=UPI0025A68406|nr:uncharacterized protein si:ch211-79k12.1 [Corythoichthys intestinalis]